MRTGMLARQHARRNNVSRWRAADAASTVSAVTASEWIVANAVLPHVVQASTRITAQNGRIVTIDQVAPSRGTTHASGTLLPGFVDLQCNGAGGHSVDEATPEALDAVAEA